MKQSKLKQTEIGEIPKDWSLVSVNDVVEKVIDNRGKTPPIQDNGIDLLEVNAVVEGEKFPDYSKVRKFVSEKTYSSWFRSGHPQMNDILLPTVGTIGNVAIMKDSRGSIAQNLIALQINKGIANPHFIYYMLTNPKTRQRLLNLNIGGVQPSIKVPHLLELKVTIPGLDEQQQITSVLSSLDDKIEFNRRMNNTLEEIGRMIFNKWFMNNVEEAIKVELQDFVEFNPRESLSKEQVTTYLEMKDLPEQGMWVYSQVKKPYKGGTKFRNGDSLMARITPCLENGKSGFVNFLEDDVVAFGSTEYIVMRPKNKMFEEFIYFLIRDDEFRDYAMKSMVGSSGRQRVQNDAVKKYMLPLPYEEVAVRFHDIMQPIFRQIKFNALENEKLSTIRDLLLPRLMSGRIRVN